MTDAEATSWLKWILTRTHLLVREGCSDLGAAEALGHAMRAIEDRETLTGAADDMLNGGLRSVSKMNAARLAARCHMQGEE